MEAIVPGGRRALAPGTGWNEPFTLLKQAEPRKGQRMKVWAIRIMLGLATLVGALTGLAAAVAYGFGPCGPVPVECGYLWPSDPRWGVLARLSVGLTVVGLAGTLGRGFPFRRWSPLLLGLTAAGYALLPLGVLLTEPWPASVAPLPAAFTRDTAWTLWPWTTAPWLLATGLVLHQTRTQAAACRPTMTG
jgi:hypothetical protein